MNDSEGDALPEKAGRKQKNRSLRGRGLAMLRYHPEFIKSYLRLTYRKRFGVPFERRFRNGYAAPPARIQINLTRRCNLKCIMCTQHRHASDLPSGIHWYDRDRELSLEAWTAFLDQAVAFRPLINVSGGEPMMYPRFKELVQAVKERGLPMQVNTNGTLLTGQAEFLVRNRVAVISVSVDGPEDIHDRIRGQKGLFKQTAEGIRAVVEARSRIHSPSPIVQIACTISKANLAFLKDMVPLAIELNADILLFQHTVFNTAENVAVHNRLLAADKAAAFGINVLQPSIPEGEYYESEIGPKDVPLLREALNAAKGQTNGEVQVFVSPKIGLDDLESYYLDLNSPRSQLCDGLWTSLKVMPDGIFSPCLHVAGGSITEQPIMEIWNSPQIRNFRQVIARRLFPGCARCCHRHF